MIEAEAVQVAAELLDAALLRIGPARAPDLDLDRLPLQAAGVGPAHAEVHPPHAEGVLAIDRSAAVDDALEESEEHQVGRGLGVGLGGEERLAVLAPEAGEPGEQAVH